MLEATEESAALSEAGRDFCVDLPAEPLFKATPHTEGNKRYVYCEPSNENWDTQRERVLQKALETDADNFLRFGSLDIGHKSMPDIAQRLGIEHPELYKIGHPVEVRRKPIVVKGVIYSGEGKAAEQANIFWSTLTEITPPQRWYPSIGGRTFDKARSEGGSTLIGVHWRGIGFWEEPVNQTVKAISVVPLEAFAKALLAGAGSDSSELTGGAALRRESLHPTALRETQGGDDAYYRAAISYLRGACCPHLAGQHTPDLIRAHFRDCGGMNDHDAAEAADRLVREVLRVIRTTDHVRQAA